MAESRKNQCSFKMDSDELEPACEPKIKRLANAILDAKKSLDAVGVQNFKFEIACHTDTRGNQEQKRQLTQRRANVIANLLVSHGIQRSWLIAVGRGSDLPIVKPDNTPAKQAKNRRYEVQVRL
jgi:OmpA-OmpF porin, OOP family